MENDQLTPALLMEFYKRRYVATKVIAWKLGISVKQFHNLKRKKFRHLNEQTLHKFAAALDMDFIAFIEFYSKYGGFDEKQ